MTLLGMSLSETAVYSYLVSDAFRNNPFAPHPIDPKVVSGKIRCGKCSTRKGIRRKLGLDAEEVSRIFWKLTTLGLLSMKTYENVDEDGVVTERNVKMLDVTPALWANTERFTLSPTVLDHQLPFDALCVYCYLLLHSRRHSRIERIYSSYGSKEIAAGLGIEKSAVVQALRLLREKEIIGRNNAYGYRIEKYDVGFIALTNHYVTQREKRRFAEFQKFQAKMEEIPNEI